MNKNIELIIYLLIFYFSFIQPIINRRKKARKLREMQGEANPSPQSQPKPANFDEVLRRIREEAEAAQRRNQPSYETTTQPLNRYEEEEPDPVFTNTYTQTDEEKAIIERQRKINEEMKDYIFSHSSTSKNFEVEDDKVVRSVAAAPRSKYRSLINSKTDIKRAIIASEILNRKY